MRSADGYRRQGAGVELAFGANVEQPGRGRRRRRRGRSRDQRIARVSVFAQGKKTEQNPPARQRMGFGLIGAPAHSTSSA